MDFLNIKKLKPWSIFTVALVAMTVAITGATFAAEPDADRKSSAKQAPPGYERFEPAPESEQVSAVNLVVLAYGAVFVGLLGYVVLVVRSQAAMGKEMVELAARLEKVDRS